MCAHMESSQAGYVDARPLLTDDLRRLSAMRPEVPVLSLYLDLDPAEFGTQRARRSAYTSLLDEAGKQVEAFDTDHEGRMSLRGGIERTASFFDDYSPKGGRGVAIFAAGDHFEAHTLPRPTRTRVMIGEAPHIAPLVVAADTRDWLIALVDTRHARLLHGNTDHLEEFEQIDDTVLGQHERQGTSDHQRTVGHEVDRHLKHVASEVERHLASRGFGRIVVGGPPEIAPRFEGQLSSGARDRIAGRFEVEVPYTSPDDVRRAATPCFQEHERRHERAMLDRLRERLGRDERAAAGIEEVDRFLRMAAVEALLYGEGVEDPDPAALERAIAYATATGADVLPLRHHPDELAEHGHIAALLRF